MILLLLVTISWLRLTISLLGLLIAITVAVTLLSVSEQLG